MEVRVQLSVTMEEGRLLYEAVAERVETLARMGFTNATEEFEQLSLMLGALKGFTRQRTVKELRDATRILQPDAR